jgi:hypothetical protein
MCTPSLFSRDFQQVLPFFDTYLCPSDPQSRGMLVLNPEAESKEKHGVRDPVP